ncbi:hypothetical protein B296_00009270 [Ensete ventricosum]|uniref:Uncharacterized protein n=1 Tax=Ensete ventricosum TaxID=4639 RepID=A0A427ALV9_ENSVE|nr:hypothetical protein B296_00009270 [Ensete ventricosum]
MVAPPVPTGTTLSLESQPLATQPPKEPPRLQVEPNHTPPRDASTDSLVRHVGCHNMSSLPDDFARDRLRVVQSSTAHLDLLFRPARERVRGQLSR